MEEGEGGKVRGSWGEGGEGGKVRGDFREKAGETRAQVERQAENPGMVR